MRLTFTHSPLDHSGLDRARPDWIAARLADPAARCVILSHGDPVAGADGGPLILHPAGAEGMDLAWPGPVFLGVADGVPWFAAAPQDGQKGVDFRRVTMACEPALAAILGRARAVLMWLGRRRFCSNCGARNEPRDGGLRLQCPSCGMEHYPRTDASVIMLPVCGERAVLGRQAAWPPGMYATLAGFMEPGETIEEACAREVREETGLDVLSARYIASQPWPFPSSLMIGLIAEVAPGEPLARDDLEDARWFTRDAAQALYETMARWAPPHYSVSRLLLQAWLDGAP